MNLGTSVYFKSADGKILQGMFLTTMILDNGESFHQLQLKDGSRVMVPIDTHLQLVEDGYYYPGSDCQL